MAFETFQVQRAITGRTHCSGCFRKVSMRSKYVNYLIGELLTSQLISGFFEKNQQGKFGIQGFHFNLGPLNFFVIFGLNKGSPLWRFTLLSIFLLTAFLKKRFLLGNAFHLKLCNDTNNSYCVAMTTQFFSMDTHWPRLIR